MKNATGFKDANGMDIYLDTKVMYKGQLYDVNKNVFNENILVNNRYECFDLADIHKDCKTITLP